MKLLLNEQGLHHKTHTHTYVLFTYKWRPQPIKYKKKKKSKTAGVIGTLTKQLMVDTETVLVRSNLSTCYLCYTSPSISIV